MRKQIYNEKQLPIADFNSINLVKDGKPILGEEDLNALLSGGRTEMMELKNLQYGGLQIAALKSKLSLEKQKDGRLELRIHPIYTQVKAPDYLTDTEAEMLEGDEVPNLEKTITDKDGNKREVLVEFDSETNEFIITDTERILVPDRVNGEVLSLDQKERYRKGKEVELTDGTRLQYTGKERQGVRSNKLALVASIMVDGGLSYALYHGLKAMFGEKHDQKSKEYSKGYEQAVKDMEKQKREGGPELNLKQESRGYNRSSAR
ncbi:MAG: DUF4099 domain-containing protein [Bacteroidetes bacterium]|nr:DUF4099 domain-containing protein [Bacteroidota bacterium]